MKPSEFYTNIQQQLSEVCDLLEEHYKDVCDFEWVAEHGKVYVLDLRIARRTPVAAIRFALQFLAEGKITPQEVLRRIRISDIESVLRPQITKTRARRIGQGFNASPGVGIGQIALSSEIAMSLIDSGHPVILVKPEIKPDDIDAIISSKGVLTLRGGLTSHAALVSRQFGIPCVCGLNTATIDTYSSKLNFSSKNLLLSEGDWISIDGSTGNVYLGKVKIQPKSWRKIPELVVIAQLADRLIAIDNPPFEIIGKLWRLRDYFVHSMPLSENVTNKRSVDCQGSFSSLLPLTLDETPKINLSLTPVSSEDDCLILIGLCKTLIRSLAQSIGIGNHPKYFRPLWNPEKHLLIESHGGERQLIGGETQLVGLEFFNVNKYLPYLPDVATIRIEFSVETDKRSRWFLDYTNPQGESVVLGSEKVLAYNIYINGATIEPQDLPKLYNILRRREYHWQWYEYNLTSFGEIRNALIAISDGKRVSVRMYILCEELGLLEDGKVTTTGISLIGAN